jgi:hypothetical protein
MTLSKKGNSFLLPSITDFVFLVLFVFLASPAGRGLLNDGDTGYHIRVGEYILKTFTIPRQDFFSFISPPIPWTAHEWLSEVIMALLYKGFGLTGVVLFFAFLISLVYAVLFKWLRSISHNILLAVFITVCAIISSPMHWLARPHVFSHLLIVIWYFMLDTYQHDGRNRLWIFPLITVVWVNLHGSFITGFILLGIYLLGNLLQSVIGPEEQRVPALAKAKALAVSTVFCLLASLINPFGFHILLFPFKLVGDKYLMDHVMEFMGMNFHEPFFFKYLLLAIIALFAIGRRKLTTIELLLVLFFLNMALYSIRHVPLFAFISAPILLRCCAPFVDEGRGRFAEFLKRKAEGFASVDGAATGHLWPIFGVAVVVICAAAGAINFTFNPKIKAVGAVEFLRREPISGNMFNNDEFGDYIIYAASPQYKVFFDGRIDMYGTPRLKEYNKVTGFEDGWEQVLEKYHMNWIIYDANSMLARHLLGNSQWRLIYADKIANIFVRNIPEYQYLIAKYPNVKPLPVDDDTK